MDKKKKIIIKYRSLDNEQPLSPCQICVFSFWTGDLSKVDPAFDVMTPEGRHQLPMTLHGTEIKEND